VETESKPKAMFLASAETETTPKEVICLLSAPKQKPKPNFGRPLLSILLYGYESWTLNTGMERRSQVFGETNEIEGFSKIHTWHIKQMSMSEIKSTNMLESRDIYSQWRSIASLSGLVM
jgi:hypothetical protein